LTALDQRSLDRVLDSRINSSLKRIQINLFLGKDVGECSHFVVAHNDLITILVPGLYLLVQLLFVDSAVTDDSLNGVLLELESRLLFLLS